MSLFAPPLARLIEALRLLPGVGPKSAQRMAFHLLEKDRDGALVLAGALRDALEILRHCRDCRMYCEGEVCLICQSSHRDDGLLCVVETPADVVAIENAGFYRGKYFILMGHLSPLDGIGPEELGLDRFPERLAQGVREVILATNPTVEGEATAHFLATLAERAGVRASRIAHGVPMGGELTYVDSGTLSHAFSGRHRVAHSGDVSDSTTETL
jgi:recombination protein RecR